MPEKKDKLVKNINHKWHLIDAKGKVLGRLATRIASLIIGKHKVQFVPYLDVGDDVVVINAKDIKVTGKKEEQKCYYRYSGYPGGLKSETLGKLRQRRPEEIIRRAVWGMLPKNKLRKRRIRRLHIFAGSEHDFEDKFQKVSL